MLTFKQFPIYWNHCFLLIYDRCLFRARTTSSLTIAINLQFIRNCFCFILFLFCFLLCALCDANDTFIQCFDCSFLLFHHLANVSISNHMFTVPVSMRCDIVTVNVSVAERTEILLQFSVHQSIFGSIPLAQGAWQSLHFSMTFDLRWSTRSGKFSVYSVRFRSM